MEWISVKDRLPEKSGAYEVRAIVGSIKTREVETRAYCTVYPHTTRFCAGDWTRITHWREQ
jgi:hypothetical protein